MTRAPGSFLLRDLTEPSRFKERTRTDSFVSKSNSTASLRRLLQHNPSESGSSSVILLCRKSPRKMRSSDGVSPESARPPQTNQQGRWLAPLPIGVLVTAFSVGGHLWDLRN